MKFKDFEAQIESIIDENKPQEESQEAIAALLVGLTEKLALATNDRQREKRQVIMSKLKDFAASKGIDLVLTSAECAHLDLDPSKFCGATMLSQQTNAAAAISSLNVSALNGTNTPSGSRSTSPVQKDPVIDPNTTNTLASLSAVNMGGTNTPPGSGHTSPVNMGGTNTPPGSRSNSPIQIDPLVDPNVTTNTQASLSAEKLGSQAILARHFAAQTQLQAEFEKQCSDNGADFTPESFQASLLQKAKEDAAKRAEAAAAAAAKEKKVNELRAKVNPYLIKFKDDLDKKLDKDAHKKEVTKIQEKIQELLEPLLEKPDQESLKKFQEECEQLLADKKKAFKQTPAIWHDVIRPALMFLLGIIPMIVTAPLRLCNSEVPGKVHKFFYVKPDSPAFKAVKEESEKLNDEVTSTLGLGAGAGAGA
ncbi:MAG: hypothetical protein P1U32_04900 [Legionellaceae bacterium]|nr:hypothetical protein [Legionellaceae bacterium]